MKPPLYYRMYQGPGVGVRSRLNDLPFYRRGGDDNWTQSGPANQLLVPGENTFTLEIFQVPPPAHSPHLRGPARFTLLYDDGDPLGEKDRRAHVVEWPAVWEPLPEEERVLPFAHVSRFVVEDEAGIPPPIYANVPKGAARAAKIEDLRAPVEEMHDAFARRDTGAFMDAVALKNAEHRRYYGPMSETDEGAVRNDVAGAFAQPWQVRPLDWNELEFDRRCDDRVVHVYRKDGGHAIEAQRVDDPEKSFATDVFLTLYEGRWRAFR